MFKALEKLLRKRLKRSEVYRILSEVHEINEIFEDVEEKYFTQWENFFIRNKDLNFPKLVWDLLPSNPTTDVTEKSNQNLWCFKLLRWDQKSFFGGGGVWFVNIESYCGYKWFVNGCRAFAKMIWFWEGNDFISVCPSVHRGRRILVRPLPLPHCTGPPIDIRHRTPWPHTLLVTSAGPSWPYLY